MGNLGSLASVLILSIFLQSCSLLSAAGFSSQGQPVKEVNTQLESFSEDITAHIDHSRWDKLLKKYVDSDGLVDYPGFKKDKDQLDNYLSMLAENEPSQEWSVQELLAYYINLYNAGTVRLIIENYPVNSIKDINGAWTKGRINIGNKKLSLGGIENGILRKMNEPRIHFAINCASISCPKLMDEAYTASKIDEQLNKATKEFINSEKNNISTSQLQISSIFEWYKKDFTADGKQDVIAFINKFSKVKINANARIDYKEYNWKLNEQ